MMFDLAFDWNILIRIFASVLFGFGLGLEREVTNKHAGLRTHILVCLGSCVFTILSIYAFPLAVNSTDPQAFGDPARIAAQVLTGIGFIGGGTVLRHGSSVYGLTTAATLWVAASIGMACGTGKISLALVATLVSVGVLVLIRSFERNVLPSSIKNSKKIRLTIVSNPEMADNVYNQVIKTFGTMHELFKKISKEDGSIKIVARADVHIKRTIQSMYASFEKVEGINSILIQEDDE